MRKAGRLGKLLLLLCLQMLLLGPVLADETEIFSQNEASAVSPNVLFLLDVSGSMRDILSDSGGKSRMTVMQEAFRDILETAPDNLNIGLMHYANASYIPSYGWDSIKGVNFPISPIDGNATEIIGSNASKDNLIDPAVGGVSVRAFMADVVDSWKPAGYTPIVDSLLEVARYFRGESPIWGKALPSYHWAAHPSTYTGSLTCSSSVKEKCSRTLGTCNGTEDASMCTSVTEAKCCNWIDDASGGYCKDNNFSCTQNVQYCQHTVCNAYKGAPIYNSPIKAACQKNYLVLMSDGKPEYPYFSDQTPDGTYRYPESVVPDQVYNSSIIPLVLPELTGTEINPAIPALIGGTCVDAPLGYKSGRCGPELTRFLINQDQSASVSGTQTVKTYTVAFGMSDEPLGTAYLAQLATAENGAYTANNKDELVAAFKGVLGDVQKDSFSFSSPSFSVDEGNMLANGNNVYVPVFDSSSSALWSGNLRKFELGDGKITGVSGSVLNEDGTFKDNAQDLWSAEPHGGDVTVGGAASQLPVPASRMLYTDVASSGVAATLDSTNVTASMLSEGERDNSENIKLWGYMKYDSSVWRACYGWYIDCNGVKHTMSGNVLSPSSCSPVPSNIKTCPGDIVSEEKKQTLLNYIRGYEAGVLNPSSPGRKRLGDMLNSKPVAVNYASGVTRVFAATNEGFLHSFDADTGIEKWAFMPKSLLRNIDAQLENKEQGEHIYGIDGPITVWRIDHDDNGVIDYATAKDYNKDGIVGADEKDGVYLFFGLRRGGREYYGVDVSNPNGQPVLMWKIVAGNDDSPGFEQLGEAWSKPTMSKMRFAVSGDKTGLSTNDTVLVFGGGYDPNKEIQDMTVRAASDSMGNDVFIVNARTGKLIWSIQKGFRKDGKTAAMTGASELKHSVPGDIRILDMDGNGSLDRLYFGDTGGNIWRVDMDMDVTDGGTTYYDYSKAKLTKLASLGGAAAGQDYRKFFYEPDTAIRLQDGKPILTIAVGSGYRSHPLDTAAVADRFYVLLDKDVYNHPGEGDNTRTKAIQDADLVDILTLESGQSILDKPDKWGWYYQLPFYGEKVLAPALTFVDKVIFTTFARVDQAGQPSIVEPCKPVVNTSRAYVLDLLSGAAVTDLSSTPDGSKDRFVVAGVNEILDGAQLVFGQLHGTNGGECSLGDCQQEIQVRVGKMELPLLSSGSAQSNEGANYNQVMDVQKLLPRMYWKNSDSTAVQGQ